MCNKRQSLQSLRFLETILKHEKFRSSRSTGGDAGIAPSTRPYGKHSHTAKPVHWCAGAVKAVLRKFPHKRTHTHTSICTHSWVLAAVKRQQYGLMSFPGQVTLSSIFSQPPFPYISQVHTQFSSQGHRQTVLVFICISLELGNTFRKGVTTLHKGHI